MKILEKLLCKHDWEERQNIFYPHKEVFLYSCKNCGKFKKFIL